MTKRSHNKKRNVGIIYEQLVLVLSQALLENDEKKFKHTKGIIKKHFAKGTELYKEFRLLNSLAVTDISDGSLATRILAETKKAARQIKHRRLELERSWLIKEINHSFGQNFYKTKVSNYKDLATIQRLLDEYRKWSDADPQFLNEYESKVHGILLEKRDVKPIEDLADPDVNPLIVKIMTKKFNEVYAQTLSDTQIAILKEWSIGNNRQKLTRMCEAVKKNAIANVKTYKLENTNQIVAEKIETVLNEMSAISFDNLNDDLVSKALIMCRIKEELAGGSNE